MEKKEDFSSLAGLQIAPDKNKQSVFTALISASLQHISLALSTGIIQLSLRNVTLNAYNSTRKPSPCTL